MSRFSQLTGVVLSLIFTFTRDVKKNLGIYELKHASVQIQHCMKIRL